jgi:Kef-type K+ transport system membrane component KefB
VVLIVAMGRWAGRRVLRLAKQHLNWPGGFIAVTALLILLASTVTEAAGVHAFLGAFLAGVALAKSRTDPEQNEAHDLIGNFVTGFFAPIYFISMGMTTNFITNFDPVLAGLMLVAGCGTKLGAVLLGAKAAGMRIGRQAWAIGFGLNARGATGIILAGVGLANKVIDERIYVSIAVMALATSIMSGPAMRRLLTPELSRAACFPSRAASATAGTSRSGVVL